MITATPARPVRPGAISASTVFAIALAIVAGLIFAWLFKIVLLDRKPAPPPQVEMATVTLAAVNIMDKTEILPIHIKTVRMPKEEYERRWPNKQIRDKMLQGNQPVGRVTRKPIMAESPIIDDPETLEPFGYPKPVSHFIREGMKPVIIEVPAKEAMVQIGDVVDLYCTMENEAFGPGGSGTAAITKNARVVARFNTTRPGAQPTSLTAPRTYTLEVTPYRFALIELAKKMGATFSVAVSHRSADNGDPSAAQPVGTDAASEPPADLVTVKDLAQLFGIREAMPAPPPWEIEKYVGLKHVGSNVFPAYSPRRGVSTQPAAPATTPPAATPGAPTLPGARLPASATPDQTVNAAPASATSSFNPRNALVAGQTRFVPLSSNGGPSSFNPRNALVAGTSNYGFRPVGAKGCGAGG